MQESPKVQENLDKAKLARRQIIRYIQVVQEEELVGTLLDANEKIVEAIQMYDRVSITVLDVSLSAWDKLCTITAGRMWRETCNGGCLDSTQSWWHELALGQMRLKAHLLRYDNTIDNHANIQMCKPAALDSDSDHDAPKKPKDARAPSPPSQPTEREMDALTRRMEAQRLEAMRTGELQKLQDRQKRESARERQRREEGRPTRYETYGTGKYEQQTQPQKGPSGRVNPDLADLDFGAPVGQQGRGLQRPLSPDSDRGGFGGG